MTYSTILAVLVLQSSLQSVLPPKDPLAEKILAGLDFALKEEYVAAESLYQTIIDDDPSSIEGRFYKAAVLQLKMTDYETAVFKDEFDRNLGWVIEHLEEKRKNEPLSAWELYYLGASHSYLAGFDARLGNWVAGFKHILQGIGYLERALRKNPELYDAYLGLGNYEYYKSKKASMLRFLPGIEDSTDKGIAMVRLAAQQAKLGKVVSQISLIWIYIEEKEFDSALDLVNQMLRKYPNNRTFLWALGEIHFRTENWIAAEGVYELLLERIESANPRNNFNTVSCIGRLATVYCELKDSESCLSACERGLSLGLSDEHRERLEKKLEDLRRSRDRCLELEREN